MVTIEVKKLAKTFQSYEKKPGILGSLQSLAYREKKVIKAVDKINFSIEEGEFVGFLGPNGAGKTTTLKMLSGILNPTSGEAKVLGFVPWKRENKFKQQFALVMGQKQQLDWDLTPADNYLLIRDLYDMNDGLYQKRLKELVELMGVKEQINQQVRRLSLGQRMKCEIIAAILHRPKILFLDEPTIGLDVVSQQKMWQFLADYNRKERATIILTSHYLEDIERLCQRVIVINEGKLLYDGKLKELIDKYSPRRIITVISKEGEKISQEAPQKQATIESKENDLVVLSVDKKLIQGVVSWLLDKFEIEDLKIESPTAREVISSLYRKAK